jgi:tetratricopeptide (TPR) repeat protein
VHALFAVALRDAGRPSEAMRAARAAVTAERRNVEAWEFLLALRGGRVALAASLFSTAAVADAADATVMAALREHEALLREAATALQRYPDLNVRYLREAVACVRARGDGAAADQEERMLARKFRSGRADLTIGQAGAMMARAMKEASVAEAVRTHNLALKRFGRGQGIDFYDKVTRPFVVWLALGGEKDEALRALDRARSALAVQRGSQLDREMAMLRLRIEAGPAAE